MIDFYELIFSIPASGSRTNVNIHWLGGPPGPTTSPGPMRSHIPHVRLSGTAHTIRGFLQYSMIPMSTSILKLQFYNGYTNYSFVVLEWPEYCCGHLLVRWNTL